MLALGTQIDVSQCGADGLGVIVGDPHSSAVIIAAERCELSRDIASGADEYAQIIGLLS